MDNTTQDGRLPSAPGFQASPEAADASSPSVSIPSAYPRQWTPSLDAALAEAVRMMRKEARSYRDSRNVLVQHMDKNVRKAFAASYDDWARVIETHAQAIEARRAETGTGSVHESAVRNADAPNLSRYLTADQQWHTPPSRGGRTKPPRS